tara:strand:+ start:166 stop:1269 length:1104 start_codon:yes stop_codon:yes gene_type:complete
MSRVKLVHFYPKNDTTSATEANANNSAINGSTQRLDAENARLQGIDMVNLADNPHHRGIFRQDNQAYETLGTNPSTYNGWIYNAFTISGTPGGQHFSQTGSVNVDFEYPINHDNTFTINTNHSKGTKVQINGSSGIALKHHDKIQVSWNVNVWDIHHNGNKSRIVPQFYMSNLVDTARSGIGVGEYYYLIYPKFDTVSNSLIDENFKSADDAGFYQDLGDHDYFDPSDLTNGNSDVQFDYDARRFDHCSVVPMHFITATETASGGGRFAAAFTFDFNSQDFATCGPPGQVSGQHTFNVNVANGGAKTLFGVQLFIAGPFRVNSNGQFLESQITDPAGTPAKNGVDVSIVLERAAIEVEIYNPQSGRQ